MRRFILLLIAWAALLLQWKGGAAGPIDIHVSVADTVGHYFQVRILAQNEGRDSLDFKMPVWIPGSYLVREFEGKVFGFRALGEHGKVLSWRKTDKNTWRVYTAGTDTVKVSYRVYAFNPDIHYSYVDADRAFVNPSSVCMYLAGAKEHPYLLRISFPENWRRITTALKPAAAGKPVFWAANYDELVDSPVEIGHHRVVRFVEKGIPFQIAVVGSGNVQPDTLVPYFRKIVAAGMDMMQQVPFTRYVFFVQLRSNSGGGLEHHNSCVLQASRWSFRPFSRFRQFLGLVAHEFFHAWNVKAIRPYPLGPFDYNRENYTRLLWVAEGFTSYYGPRLLLRAGLLPEKDYLRRIQRSIENLRQTPGRHWQSLVESSFDAWIKYYRRDEDSPNTTVSYYSKGALVALALDLQIRQDTRGRRSLDDVMRRLYEQYHLKADRAYTLEEFKSLCEEVAGHPFDDFFQRYILGTEDIDFQKYFRYVGLELKSRKRPSPQSRQNYGFGWRGDGGRIIVTQVLHGSPAYRMGISAGDELIALDTYRLSPQNLRDVFSLLKPGAWHYLTVNRDGRVRRLRFEWSPWTLPSFVLRKADQRTPEQKELYRSWLFQEGALKR